MRHISPKWLCLFMATAVFVSPLLVIADDICRCPDCARRICVIKPKVSSCRNCCENTSLGTDQDGDTARQSNALAQSFRDVNPEKPGHPSPTESKDSNCNACIYTHGNAILPIGDAGTCSPTEAFHQPIPKIWVTSGWVYQILHPPRQFAA